MERSREDGGGRERLGKWNDWKDKGVRGEDGRVREVKKTRSWRVKKGVRFKESRKWEHENVEYHDHESK